MCDRIPQLEDVDGNVANRVRCIPYESRFVDEALYAQSQSQSADKAAHNLHLIDSNIEANFTKWRACMMRLLLDAYTQPMMEPEEVTQHTKNLIERDSISKSFITECTRESQMPKLS